MDVGLEGVCSSSEAPSSTRSLPCYQPSVGTSLLFG